ncbi:MAG: GGDEF domain-containing protein, partial [Spirochaetaceae bacterium]|nr:GGDEF domain-containing protein [Spirochaetaceae bacterium]
RSEISPNSSYTIGRSKDCDIVLQDHRVSRVHAQLIGQKDSFLLVDKDSTNGSWMEGKNVGEVLLREGSQFRLGNCNCEIQIKETSLEQGTPPPSDTMIFESQISRILEDVKDETLADRISELKNYYNHKKEALADLAFRDTLTGLYNRRYFDTKLEEEYKRAQRYHRPLSLVMIDIDHFKKFNDTYGHQKGDEVLTGVAVILQETSRNLDILCRYGGEEMIFILPETPGEQALKMAQFCCTRVEENSTEIAEVAVTISLGVANITPWTKGPEDLLNRADSALYLAKDGGRNQAQWKK